MSKGDTPRKVNRNGMMRITSEYLVTAITKHVTVGGPVLGG